MSKDPEITRRAFLAAAGGTILSIGLPGVFVKLSHAEQQALAEETRPDGRPRLPPGQTAVARIRDMGGTPGTTALDDWRLEIRGEVGKPLVLTFDDLLALEQVNIICDIHCVTGWSLLDSQWTGVRLTTIWDMVRPTAQGNFVIFEAPGYTTNVPIGETRKADVILAHGFFGGRLPLENGAPVRGIVPDLYLYKSAKWLEGITVSTHDAPGFWETRGYSNSADPWKEERYQH